MTCKDCEHWKRRALHAESLLPKTADGKVVGLGAEVYYAPAPDDPDPYVEKGWVAVDPDEDIWFVAANHLCGPYEVGRWYSTEQAAREAGKGET